MFEILTLTSTSKFLRFVNSIRKQLMKNSRHAGACL